MPRRKTWANRRPLSRCEVGTLHAFGPGYLHAPNHMLEFRGSDERQLSIPLRGLQIVCLYGPVRVTAGAIRLITDAGAALAYFSANGYRINGVLHPPNGAIKTRRYRQFVACQDRAWTLSQAKQIVIEKLTSMTEAAEHFRRHGRPQASLVTLLRELPDYSRRIADCPNHDVLRGLEGASAKLWFDALGSLLPEGWSLPGRVKRPPTDPVNALLSLGYTMLHQRIEAACVALGLDGALGVLHDYRQGRASLACDLMEPWRIPAVDRVLLSCLNRRLFEPGDFEQQPDGSVRLTSVAFKRWLSAQESWLHDTSSDQLTLHRRMFQRLQQFAESLPPSQWPADLAVDTMSSEFADADEVR
ncbi:MAG: CRISPR-associated endonuclease Cas1 [Planctomycetaceae bacterium]|nr:CRISPR-associated endonuclease Cas1 [Planctomycetaceae bacterium]